MVTKNFKYVPAVVHKGGGGNPDIIPLQKPTQNKDLGFFAHAFAKQIQEFSTSLRSRYLSKEQYEKKASSWQTSDESKAAPGACTRKVFSQDIAEKWEEERELFYGSHMNDIAGWIEKLIKKPDGTRYYVKEETVLPTIVKILIKEGSAVLEGRAKVKEKKEEVIIGKRVKASVEVKEERMCNEAMETLLLLANQKDVLMDKLRNQGHYYECGIETLVTSCLQAYLMLNVLVVMKEAGSPIGDQKEWDSARPQPTDVVMPKIYMECMSYRAAVRGCSWHTDTPSRALLHDNYFGDGGTKFFADPLADMDAVQEHLKRLWRMVTVYDLVLREAGHDPDIEYLVLETFGKIFAIPYGWDPETQKIYLLCGDEKRRPW